MDPSYPQAAALLLLLLAALFCWWGAYATARDRNAVLKAHRDVKKALDELAILEDRIETLRTGLKRVESRVNKRNREHPPERDPDAEPDPKTDPEGWRRYHNNRLLRERFHS